MEPSEIIAKLRTGSCTRVVRIAVEEALCENTRLRERLNEAIRNEDELQCEIASAFGWDMKGELFGDAVRRVVADNKRLRPLHEHLWDERLELVQAIMGGRNATQEKAVAEARRLRPIVDKLPKDDQGDSIVPNTTRWYIQSRTNRVCPVLVETELDHAWLERGAENLVMSQHIRESFATREAAEAARGK